MSLLTPGENPAIDAETRVPILIGTAIAITVASTLVVMLRLYTRHVIVHAPGIDDYTMVIATILSIAVTGLTIVQAQNGLGRHVWLVSASQTLIQLKALLASEMLYNCSQILTKISFLLQYRRIFRDTLTHTVCFWLILFLTLWGITQEFLVVFACFPVSIFVPSLADKCIYSLIVWYLTSIMNIVTDFIIFTVPIPAIRNLRLPLRQKILVMSLFCLGFFTCIISIVRLFTLRATMNSPDTTWDNSPTSWWSTIELNCGILCSSIATLRPLIRKLSKNGATQASQSSKAGGGYKAGYLRQGSAQQNGSSKGGAFPMQHMASNESQNVLKEEALSARDGSLASYEYAEAARNIS